MVQLFARAAFAVLAVILAAGPAASQDRRQNQPGAVRLLRALAVLVAVLLRSGGRAGRAAAAAMRRAAVFLCRAWAMAAVRARLSGILPAAAASPRPQHGFLDARSDAGTGSCHQ